MPSAADVRSDRYELFGAIASGGMATVHFGRLLGAAGFARSVAIKRLHPHYSASPELVGMLHDEARLVSRIRHPNVVPTLDMIETDGEIFMIMEYVPGESLARLLRTTAERSNRVPLEIVLSVIVGVLHGLHAAHTASDERGEPLGIVHRDVSPHNVLVGTDGLARLLDFGVAKARGRLQTTRDGQVKGKLAYLAPEQILCDEVTPRTDVYATAVVLWEALTCRRLFAGTNDGSVLHRILDGDVEPPSALVEDIPPALDRLVLRGLERDPERRFASALDFAAALEEFPLARAARVGEWVREVAAPALAERAKLLSAIELAPRQPIAAPALRVVKRVDQATVTDAIQPEAPANASGVSVVTDAKRSAKPSGRRSVRTLALLAAIPLTAGAALWIGRQTRAGPEPSGASSMPAPSASVSPSVEAPAVSASSGSPVDNRVAPPRGTHTSPSPPRPASRSAPTDSRAPDCTVPYVVDKDGIRRWKRECR